MQGRGMDICNMHGRRFGLLGNGARVVGMLAENEIQ